MVKWICLSRFILQIMHFENAIKFKIIKVFKKLFKVFK